MTYSSGHSVLLGVETHHSKEKSARDVLVDRTILPFNPPDLNLLRVYREYHRDGRRT